MGYKDRNNHATCRTKRGRDRYIYIFLVIALTIYFSVLCENAYAFGIATPYLENDTLRLEPGQSYTYVITLQNNDDTDYYVDFNYTSDVATLKELPSIVPSKSYNTQLSFDIKIPDKAFPGDRFSLAYSARPILNKTGQVGMTVEIRRTLKIEVVEKNGQGYKITFGDRIGRVWQDLFEKSRAGLYYLGGVIAIVILGFLTIRLWRLSKGMSEKIAHHRHAAKEPHAPFAISHARNIHDIMLLLEQIPEKEFELAEIRKLFSEKLLELNEVYLSKKILTVKSKDIIIEMLKE